MSTRETVRQRGARRGRRLLLRIGEELRTARVAAVLSLRQTGAIVGVSHTQVRRIERGLAPHVDIDVLARMAAALGHDLSLGLHPMGSPLRDAAHLRLLGRLRVRLPTTIRWRSEVPIPIAGDWRSADALIDGARWAALVEAETRLGDIQAVERRTSAKARDLRIDRVILLVLDSRHNRDVIRMTPELRRRYPIATRAALLALGRGEDPGGDCLIVL